MTRRRHRSQRKQLVWGLMLITLGILFFLDQLHVADLGSVFRDFWPLFIVVPGVAKLFDSESRGSGIRMIGIGSWLLVVNLGLWGLTWGNSWPLILIFVGASILFEGIFPGSGESNRDRAGEGDEGV